MKELTESIWKQADSVSTSGQASEQERVVALFRHLMRNMALLQADSPRIPVGLYEAMLTGIGNVDDRIWAFAEALRQRSLDTIVLQAATPGDPASPDVALAADVLIGVVLEDRLLLFIPCERRPSPSQETLVPLLLTLPAWKPFRIWNAGKMVRLLSCAIRPPSHPEC